MPTPVEIQRRPRPQTLRVLGELNFFLADVRTGVGPFLAIYLAGYKGNEERIGLALTVGGIAGSRRSDSSTSCGRTAPQRSRLLCQRCQQFD